MLRVILLFSFFRKRSPVSYFKSINLKGPDLLCFVAVCLIISAFFFPSSWIFPFDFFSVVKCEAARVCAAQTFLPRVSPVEKAHFLWQGSWYRLVLQDSQSCRSSLRRRGVRRRGSTLSPLLPAHPQQRPGGRRTEAEAVDDAMCWEARTLRKEGWTRSEHLKGFGQTAFYVMIKSLNIHSKWSNVMKLKNRKEISDYLHILYVILWSYSANSGCLWHMKTQSYLKRNSLLHLLRTSQSFYQHNAFWEMKYIIYYK